MSQLFFVLFFSFCEPLEWRRDWYRRQGALQREQVNDECVMEGRNMRCCGKFEPEKAERGFGRNEPDPS